MDIESGPYDLRKEKGPCKYNGMFVDLSQGFEELEEKFKDWDDDWVMETSIPLKGVFINF
jgi:hypothetical protein